METNQTKYAHFKDVANERNHATNGWVVHDAPKDGTQAYEGALTCEPRTASAKAKRNSWPQTCRTRERRARPRCRYRGRLSRRLRSAALPQRTTPGLHGINYVGRHHHTCACHNKAHEEKAAAHRPYTCNNRHLLLAFPPIRFERGNICQWRVTNTGSHKGTAGGDHKESLCFPLKEGTHAQGRREERPMKGAAVAMLRPTDNSRTDPSVPARWTARIKTRAAKNLRAFA